jgi:hypothetical protein
MLEYAGLPPHIGPVALFKPNQIFEPAWRR